MQAEDLKSNLRTHVFKMASVATAKRQARKCWKKDGLARARQRHKKLCKAGVSKYPEFQIREEGAEDRKQT